jgi:phage/plasmid-like protein (TIGR03299 family)
MAHDLATANGRTSMFFVGEAPWHRLGTRLDNPATAAEAIVAAGLDYDVTLTGIATTDGTPVTNRRAVIRTDTRQVLGVVSPSYVPIQNRACFAFLDEVVAAGDLRYHTAGALGKGERVWLLAKLPGEIRVRGGTDVVDKFLLLSNSHDGSSALRVFFTPIRVVCANTLSLAHRQGHGQGVAISHKGNLSTKVRHAREVLGLAHEVYADAEAKIELLASHAPNSVELDAFFRALVPDPIDADPTRARNIRAELHRLFEEGMGQDLPGVRHTTWAAVNAVTEYVDHHRSTRGSNPNDRSSQRLQSAWFGPGAVLKTRAWELALELATAV